MLSHGTGRSRRAALLAVVVALGGCATRGDLRELQYEVRSLAVRQDSAFQALRRIVERSGAEAIDSVAEVATLLFELRGEVNNRLLAIQDQQLRMGELVGQSQHSIELMSERLDAQRRELAIVSRQSADTVAEAGDEDVEEPPDAPRPDPAAEHYNAVVGLVERGSFLVARGELERFLEEYPNSEFAAGAYLHLADIKARNDDEVEDAITAYRMIPDLFPEAAEVPQALFQAGLLCAYVEDYERARGYLEWLLDSFPDHRLAPQARERLEEIP